MRRLLAVLAVMLVGSQAVRAGAGDDAQSAKAPSVAVPEFRWVSPTEVTRLPESTGRARTDALPGHDDFVEVSSMPVVTKEVPPLYPAGAEQDSVGADLWIQSLVDSNGTVQTARISVPTGLDPEFGFERAALIAALQQEFAPASKDGKPVAVWVTYKVSFRMD